MAKRNDGMWKLEEKQKTGATSAAWLSAGSEGHPEKSRTGTLREDGNAEGAADRKAERREKMPPALSAR